MDTKLRSLEKRLFDYRLEPILDPPVKPEDDKRDLFGFLEFLAFMVKGRK